MIKVKTSKRRQAYIDTMQPYYRDSRGKRITNKDYLKIYGEPPDLSSRVDAGSGQEGTVQELRERNRYEEEKRRGIERTRYYV